MALGAKEAAPFSIFSSNPSISPILYSCNKPLYSFKFHIFPSTLAISLKFQRLTLPLLSSSQRTQRPGFQLHSAVESVTIEENVETSLKKDGRRKLFVLNLPWSLSVVDIKTLFGECGTVSDVEIIKKDGKNRGFAFVTMASPEEAQAAIDKFDSHDLAGRVIKVQFAKRFKRPPRPPAPLVNRPREPRYKLYVSNLAWKVRSNNLRDIFLPISTPLSTKVVFENSSGRSSGYGFVSFATKEEAESAISALNGKELFGRSIRLKLNEADINNSESKEEEESNEASINNSESKEEESNEANINNSESKEEEESNGESQPEES